MTRQITNQYQDPLDSIWETTAKKLGLRVERGPGSYASTDGAGLLSLSDPEGMDPDDCVAQMIFHELCHSLVQGSQSFGWVDWGLDNVGEVDVEREHACMRLQAALSAPFGLRRFMAPTTDFRIYYDALPEDPFEEKKPSEREAITRARAAWARRKRRPWRMHLEEALEATRNVLIASASIMDEKKKGSSLLDTLDPRTSLHPSGLPLQRRVEAPASSPSCSSCAWSFEGGRGKKVLRCRQAEDARVHGEDPACTHFEASFDCLSCGACCREAYDTVEVSPRDPAKRRYLNLMVPRLGGLDMKRDGSRCICLKGGIPLKAPQVSISGGSTNAEEGLKVPPLSMPGGADFTCDIYADRPQTCRDFTIFSEHCLSARRSVGLSR